MEATGQRNVKDRLVLSMRAIANRLQQIRKTVLGWIHKLNVIHDRWNKTIFGAAEESVEEGQRPHRKCVAMCMEGGGVSI